MQATIHSLESIQASFRKDGMGIPGLERLSLATAMGSTSLP